MRAITSLLALLLLLAAAMAGAARVPHHAAHSHASTRPEDRKLQATVVVVNPPVRGGHGRPQRMCAAKRS